MRVNLDLRVRQADLKEGEAEKREYGTTRRVSGAL